MYKAFVELRLSETNPDIGTPVFLALELKSNQEKHLKTAIRNLEKMDKYKKYKYLHVHFIVEDMIKDNLPSIFVINKDTTLEQT